jgi:hypothetical protein
MDCQARKYNALNLPSPAGRFVSGHEFTRAAPCLKKKMPARVSASERDVHGAQHHFGIREGLGSEVAGQGQAAVPVDD